MRVLVVEDEDNIASYLKKSLEAEGFDVDIATDGLNGLDLALTGAYSAITLDVMLPGMNGYSVCRKIREAGLTTPVLMLTAKDGEYDEADAFDIGADDFLSKPFSLVVLVARLRSLMRRQSKSVTRVLSVGDLSLDPGHRVVKRGDVTIELTPREFTLLEFLMYNEGQTLTKTQILDHVWDKGFLGDENVVEVYVGYLRRKIDAPFGVKSLKTVRGVGYRLAAD